MRTLTLTITLFLAATASAQGPTFADRWVYCAFNLYVDKNADEAVKLIERSAKAGYTGMVLADYKFNILGRMEARYFKNIEKLKAAAVKHKIELIPSVFPMGYSDGILTHDPNLAEGLPVRDAPYVAKGTELVQAGKPPAVMNGGFEDARGDKLAGMGFQDGAGEFTFVDRNVAHTGKASLRMQNATGNCRVQQRLKLRPWTCYRMKVWIKTNAVKGADFKLLALGDNGRALTFFEAPLKPDQDWTELTVVFNSLANAQVNVYAGLWGGFTGTLWADDWHVEEMGLTNVLRRGGCPFAIKSKDGQTTYEEGKDFLPVKDDVMHEKTSGGEWTFAHPGPKVQLTAKSRIKSGQEVRLSWYHPVFIHGEQVVCSLVEPKVFELMKDQAKRVNDLFKPKTFFMSHDEIRVAGWCKVAEKSGKTPGQLLADNVRQSVQIIKSVNPQARIAVWSDMFDPHHNAVDNYYLVNGSWKGSWEGLPKNVIIANWNLGKAKDSLQWFTERGHEQVLAGYYDGDDLHNVQSWNTAAKNVKGVRGFMYTTWQKKYGLLEDYGKVLRGK